MSLRIGILGTRGVPNYYGGFEQFASYLSQMLAMRGHDLFVYAPHYHLYKENRWKGVTIIKCYDPSSRIGTAGQFIYDLNCVIDARKRKFDILLVLGYTSSSVWGRLYPRKSLVVTNMDGLEWKRSKYSPAVQWFLRYAEKLAVRFSDIHVADAIPIQEYLFQKYAVRAAYISYGAEMPGDVDEHILSRYGLAKNAYSLLIARMEPENNIEVILNGLHNFYPEKKVLIVGSLTSGYGKKMVQMFTKNADFIFAGSIYDKEVLNSLRTNCAVYFHGHSVGGTNPSLLEAMASGALICAHDNVFNRSVLGDEAFYFTDENDIAKLHEWIKHNETGPMISANQRKIRERHSWEKIVGDYEELFLGAKKGKR